MYAMPIAWGATFDDALVWQVSGAPRSSRACTLSCGAHMQCGSRRSTLQHTDRHVCRFPRQGALAWHMCRLHWRLVMQCVHSATVKCTTAAAPPSHTAMGRTQPLSGTTCPLIAAAAAAAARVHGLPCCCLDAVSSMAAPGHGLGWSPQQGPACSCCPPFAVTRGGGGLLKCTQRIPRLVTCRCRDSGRAVQPKLVCPGHSPCAARRLIARSWGWPRSFRRIPGTRSSSSHSLLHRQCAAQLLPEQAALPQSLCPGVAF